MFGLGLVLVCAGVSGLVSLGSHYYFNKEKKEPNNNYRVNQALENIADLIREFEESSRETIQETATEKENNVYPIENYKKEKDVFEEFEGRES
jgi:hypothetical protein